MPPSNIIFQMIFTTLALYKTNYQRMLHPPKPYTPKQYLKTQSMLHLAFLGAMLSLATVACVVTDTWQLRFDYMEDQFFFISPILAISGIVLSNYLFQKQLQNLKTSTSLKAKLERYQSAKLIVYACIEAPALLAIVIFIQTENAYYLIIALLLIGYFFFQRPSKEIIESDLNLNNEMKNAFNKSEQLIGE